MNLTPNQEKALLEHGRVVYKVNNSTENTDYVKGLKYVDWLNKCSFISDNGEIVKIDLNEDTECEIVYFEGYVGWYKEFGGFTMKGKIDLIMRAIVVDIYWKNTNEYETKRISIDSLEKGRVR